MPVEYDPKTGLINLHNDQISYVIQILVHRYPVHRYFGRYFSKQPYFEPIPSGSHAFANDPTERFPYSVTSLPLEYSTIGSGDYRQPAYVIKDANNQLLPVLQSTNIRHVHRNTRKCRQLTNQFQIFNSLGINSILTTRVCTIINFVLNK